MRGNFLAGLALAALGAAFSGCNTPPPVASSHPGALPPGLIDISDTPGLPRNEAFEPDRPPKPAPTLPGTEVARDEARDAATAGMPPGKVAGGTKEALTLRPVEVIEGKTPLPPPPPDDERAKPVLKSRALDGVK
jgi:hypothetical protein